MNRLKNVVLTVALLGLLVCLAFHCNEPRLPQSRKEADRVIQKALADFCKDYNLDPGKFILHEVRWSERAPWWYKFGYNKDSQQYVSIGITNRGAIDISGYWPDRRNQPPVVPTGRPRMSPIGSEEAESKKDTNEAAQ